MLKRLLAGSLVALGLTVAVVWAADGPLTPLMQLRTRTDASGYLRVSGGAYSGADGPLTPMANLRGRVDGSGYLRVAMDGLVPVQGVITTDQSAMSTSAEWNNAAVNFTHWKAAITDTASNTGSAVISTTVNGSNTFSVSKAGQVDAGASLVAQTGVYPGGTGKSLMASPSNGILVFTNAATNSFTRLALGEVGTGFPGLAVSTTRLTQTLADGSSGGTLSASGALITAGSATGLTVSDPGSIQTQVYKVTVATTAFICAAVTCDLTIGTLPANTWLTNVTASLATTFACTATCTSSTLSLLLGKGAGAAEYLASFDADAATGIFGDADAEMGTLLTRAAAIQSGTFTAGSQAVVLRLTSGTGNIGTGAATNLSQGSIVIWLKTTRLP